MLVERAKKSEIVNKLEVIFGKGGIYLLRKLIGK
jgi:hypothetical protein